MASYRDWMHIENPNTLDERQLRLAIRSMGAAANKRLKRMENAGVNFGKLSKQTGVTAGVRNFTVRGKNKEELNAEFKRVRNFLNDPQSSLSGMWNIVKDYDKAIDSYDKDIRRIARRRKQLSRKDKKDESKRKKQQKTYGNEKEYYEIDTANQLTRYEKIRAWRELWDVYNNLREEGYYSNMFNEDSNQVREMIYAVTSTGTVDNLTTEEMINKAREVLESSYIQSKRQQTIVEKKDISTSQFISYGKSD